MKESKDVVIIDEIEDNSGFAYLKPKDKVFLRKDLDYDVLILRVELEG